MKKFLCHIKTFDHSFPRMKVLHHRGKLQNYAGNYKYADKPKVKTSGGGVLGPLCPPVLFYNVPGSTKKKL